MGKKIPFILLLVAVAIILVVWRLVRPAAVVHVIHPRAGTIRAYVEERAVTELPHDYLIAMPVDGWLERIPLREGDRVEKDAIIARVEKDDLLDRVEQAEKRVAVLQTDIRETVDNRLENNILKQTVAMVKAFDETVKASEAKLKASEAIRDFALTEVERLNQVREAQAAADQELRAAETEYRRSRAQYQSDALQLAALKTLQAVSFLGPQFMKDYIDRKLFKKESYEQQLAQAQAELEIVRRNLARADIESPITGVVLHRHETRRQYLPAGTPLLTLGRLEDMEVIAEVLTERATRIAPDDPVEIYGEAILAGSVPGKVARIYPAGFKKVSSLGVEQQRVNVAVTFDEIPPQLGVDFRVHVRIYYEQADDALVLPRTALFRGDGGQWQVMRVEDKTTPLWRFLHLENKMTTLQTVTIGLMNDDEAQILEPLTADDVILARPAREITENLRVKTVPLE